MHENPRDDYVMGGDAENAPFFDLQIRASGQIVRKGPLTRKTWASGKVTYFLPVKLDCGKQFKRSSNPRRLSQRNTITVFFFDSMARRVEQWHQSFLSSAHAKPWIQVWGSWETVYKAAQPDDPLSHMENTGAIVIKAQGWATAPLLKAIHTPASRDGLDDQDLGVIDLDE